MSDKLLRFGSGGQTSLTPFTLLVLVAASVAIFTLPRKKMVIPLLFTSIFIPLSQQIAVAGLNFMVFRILLLVAWARIIFTGGLAGPEGEKFVLNSIDKAMICWALVGSVAFVALWGEFGAVIQRLGFLYNTFGFYFLFRILFRDEDDANRAVKVLAVICAVLALCMLNEKVTGRNLFSVFGAVPEFSYIREGKLRAQAGFAHPILAGTFGAILLPLFLGLLWQNEFRWIAFLGIVSSAIVTITSASSTPLAAFIAGFGALFFMWPLRKHMRLIRWGILLTVIGLHLVMKAPVWALISRVDFVGGSSNDHRYQLVNQTILRFSEWWLVGTQHVSSWGFEMGDTSNTYVEAGVTGGIFSLILFIAIIVLSFKTVGIALKKFDGDRIAERRAWALGAALFANVVAYVGITYFDQTIIAWYVLLALIPVSASGLLHRAGKPDANHLAGGQANDTNINSVSRWAGHDRTKSARPRWVAGARAANMIRVTGG